MYLSLSIMENHDKFMQRCYQLAQLASDEGESPVGSVIVKGGIIIGEGTEKSRQLKDITRHAEIVAILDALESSHDLREATLYTNVEPCLLCSYAIRHYRIKKIVFSKYSGELGGTHKPFNILTSSDFESWDNPPEILFYENRKL